MAIFLDGCFWHGCPDHGVLPKNNREWWRAKLEGNRERDRRKDEELTALGWLPVHVWEHVDVAQSAEEIRRLWRARTGRNANSAASV
jgi:DNA mismatch endonuclease (patch repair protein)